MNSRLISLNLLFYLNLYAVFLLTNFCKILAYKLHLIYDIIKYYIYQCLTYFIDIYSTFTLDPESRSVLLGNNIQLQCISPKSEPVAKIYWEKDGKRVTGLLNATLVLAAQSILSATIQIQNMSHSSTGRYRCVAYNILLMNKVVNSNYADVTIAGMTIASILKDL